jgi:tetratricopeptide (TPR) repeat protein
MVRRSYIVTALLVAAAAGFGWAAAPEGPSLSDLNLLTVPSSELPAGQEELATKLEFARAFILSGKPKEALELLDEVEARDLQGTFTVEVLYYRGFALDVAGDYAAALVNYAEALKRRPGDTSLLLAQGQAYLDAGRGDEAKASFAAALAGSPENSAALTGLAYLDLATGDLAAAEDKLTRAVASDGSNALALSYLGLVEMQRKDFAAARGHLERAVELEPNNLTANYNLAAILFMQKEYGAAEQRYRAVLERKPTDAEARYYLALSLEAQGRYREALAEADATVKSGQKVDGLVELMDRLGKEAGGEPK